MINDNNNFSSCDKSLFWSLKNDLMPSQLSKSSSKKFIFDCNICSHEFYITPGNIALGQWCSYCSNKKLCNEVEC